LTGSSSRLIFRLYPQWGCNPGPHDEAQTRREAAVIESIPPPDPSPRPDRPRPSQITPPAHAWIAEQREDILRLLCDTYAARYRIHQMRRHHWQEQQAALQATLDTVREELKRIRAAEDALHLQTAALQGLTVETTLAEQRERRAIAEQYREELAQLLVGIKYHAGVLAQERDLQGDPHWQELARLLDTAVRASLTIGGHLAPHILDHDELLAAVEWLARWMRDRYDLTVEVSAPPGMSVPSATVTPLLVHAIRHLLINAATHGQGKTAQVALVQQNGCLRITVRDDGIGFDPADVARRPSNERVGLASLQQMVDYLGGKLEIVSTPGQGSRVTLTVPLPVSD
jgi:signal transduction histidine kinase